MKKLPIECPSCEGALEVTQLTCGSCETKIMGNYTLPMLLQLPPDDLSFVTEFIINSGSLKKMALNLGKSYPTVRNKLDDIISKINQLQSNQ